MIVYEYDLDMVPGLTQGRTVVSLSQYDDNFFINFHLYTRNGSFVIESGTTARIRGTKPDGNGFSATATVDASDMTVLVEGDKQMTAAAGTSQYELTLMKGTKELNTANFDVYIERAALDIDTPSSETKLRELYDLPVDEILQAATTAVDAKDDAEDARDAAIAAKDEAVSVTDGLMEIVRGSFIYETASGAMASFPDGGDGLPVKSVSVNVDPVQDTSGGAPSPTNICPITGHTSAAITRVGKNLLPMTVDGIKAANGGASSWSRNSKTIHGVTFTINTDSTGNVISITANGTSSDAWLLLSSFTYAANISYVINGCPAGGSAYTYGIESDNLNMRDIGSGVTILQTPDYTDNIYVYVKTGTTMNNVVFKPMIRFASDTDPTFEPYQSHVYNVTFPGAAGTVYGGTLDVNAGRLTVDKAYIASYSGQSINAPWLSSMDEYAAGRTPTTGAQVVYPLTTPVTYNLTAEEITTLLGINHIWADTGDVSVEYAADPKLYINKVIANALNA